MRIPLGLSYGLRCGDSMKRRDIAEEEKDDFSKILHGPKKPLNYFYRKSQIKYSYHGAFTEKPEVDSAARNLDGFVDKARTQLVLGIVITREKSPQLSFTTSFLALVYCIKKLGIEDLHKVSASDPSVIAVDKTILVEAMVLRLDRIGFLDRSNNNYSWKSLFLVFIFTVPWYELLVQRYWWESAGGVNFLDPEPSILNDLCDPSQYVPFMGSGHLSINSHHLTCQEETDISLENPPVVYPETEEQVFETITSPVHSEGSQLESGEFALEFCESWECPKQEPEEEETLQETTDSDNNDLDQYQEREFSDFGQLQQNPEHCTVESARDSFVPWSPLLGSRKTGKKRQTKTEKTISFQVLRKYFAGSLKDAAKSIGVCPTTLKRMCRQYGISRWPSRKIKKVNHSLKKLQHVVDSVMGAQGLIEIDSFYTAFPELSSSGYFGHNPFSSFQITDYPEESNPKPINHLFSTKGPVSKSQSSSSSQNSGLFICHGKRQLTSTINGLSTGHALAVEDPVEVLKRTRSKSELPSLNKEELDRTKSNETSCQRQNLETQASLPISNGRCLRYGGVFRIKATFGDENIRFSLQPNWGFRDLQREIAKRFEIDDFSRIGLKYLDNDHESILLTCDADLEECKDLLGFSQSRTIKITLYLFSKPNLGSSFGGSRDLF
ncbi:hypothetical protein POTOM_033105 [Populus tomentosa]|uniref:Plant regulator RWP-RK family protein n=1 Tax=Populus tomentosa TaxID=118781 RepID=A0A8X7YZV4_POPTO|nr:hypothetical protein POTOM_033105 [Populus tomentosa]